MGRMEAMDERTKLFEILDKARVLVKTCGSKINRLQRIKINNKECRVLIQEDFGSQGEKQCYCWFGRRKMETDDESSAYGYDRE